MTLCTQVLKNYHNSTGGAYFFHELAVLCSAHIELSFHAKNSIFMKIPNGLFFLMAGLILLLLHDVTVVHHNSY